MHTEAHKDNVMRAIKLYRTLLYKEAMLKAKQNTSKIDQKVAVCCHRQVSGV